MLLSNRTTIFVHPNFADFLVFADFFLTPAVIRHLEKGPDPVFSCMCMLWPANLCIATAVCDGKDKIVLGWQAGNALYFHFYLHSAALSKHKGRLRSLLIFLHLHIHKATKILSFFYFTRF